MGAPRRILPLILGACLLASAAAAQEAEEIEALQLWLEEPLDLREATVEELLLLPWLDRRQAEAVVGLREAGGLRRLEDLDLVPGLGRDQRRALAPFVRLPAAAPALRLRLLRRGRARPGDPLRTRDKARMGWGSWQVAGEGRGGAPLRVACGWEGERATAWVGQVRARLPWHLLWDDPLGRGRSGAPVLSRSFTVGPYLSLIHISEPTRPY
mgnify:CR=1 FL=1